MNEGGDRRQAPLLLSVAMIARDEERHIGRALEGLLDFADEVVVVDTGSRDRTPAIAAAAGARVVRARWTEDFAAARNCSLKEAAGAWVLVLDADEAIDLVNGTRIRRACERAPAAVLGYLLEVVSATGAAAVDIQHAYPRLLRGGAGIHFTGAVHEEPRRADSTPLAAGLELLPVRILHFGYSDPLKNHRRVQRNLRLLEREARRRPGDRDTELKLAVTEIIAGRLQHGAVRLERLLGGTLDRRREVVAREYLAMAARRLGRPREAAAELARVLRLAPRRRSARLTRAQLLLEAGQPAAALAVVRDLIDDLRGDGAAAEVRVTPAALQLLAAECLLALEDLEGARAAAAAARVADPTTAGRLEARIAGCEARRAPAGHRISAALIVRDAARDLPGCLESLAEVADEVVIADTGSRDGTPAVARAAGARVLSRRWRDDFAAARNAALGAARGDWILVIDADERLRPDGAAAIRRAVAGGGIDGARLWIESPTAGDDPLASERERSLRLFRRLPGVCYTGRVHEQIEPALAAIGARVGDLDATLVHHGYADPVALRAKRKRNLRLLRLEVERRGGDLDGLLAFHYGLTLQAAGRAGVAVRYLELAVEPARRLQPALAARAHARLAQLQLELGHPGRAAAHLEESRAVAPGDLFARYVEAGCRYASGDPGAAAAILRELLEQQPEAAPLRAGLVQLDLGDALLAAGERAAAARAYAAAARELPADPRPAARLRALAVSA